MKKALTTALAALTFGGAVVATAAPAQAQRYDRHHGRYYDSHRHNNRSGDALAAGVVGLALGAALASGSNNNRGYYQGGYYNGGGYGYYDDGPRRYRHRSTVCETNRWVWDPYIGRRVMVRERYRC